MSVYEQMVVNLILLIFPLVIYALYLSYNTQPKERELYLDLTLFSSLFLMIRYATDRFVISSIILINLPLLIGYMKNRTRAVIIMSIAIILYYNPYLPIQYEIIEYSIYLIIYFLCRHKKLSSEKILNSFICIKSFLIGTILIYKLNPSTPFLSNLTTLILVTATFIFCTYSILYLLRKGESAIEKNKLVKELEREKDLRISLFKITHEIKNPIAVCKGYLEMLDYNNEKKVKKYIPIIKNEIERTLTVINDFSDYGKLKIEKEIIDLSVLLEDVFQMLTPLFEEKKVKNTLFMKEDELYLEVDYNRIKQVLVNLLKNAIEAQPEDRELELKLEVKKQKESVKLIIEDNGVGMSKENLAKISNIFYTTKQSGTGLGVALSKEILELHNGSLTYKSQLGKGTKAIIKLPLLK